MVRECTLFSPNELWGADCKADSFAARFALPQLLFCPRAATASLLSTSTQRHFSASAVAVAGTRSGATAIPAVPSMLLSLFI